MSKIFSNVKGRIESWVVKVVSRNGFAGEDFVAREIEDEISSSIENLANSDWVEDVEAQASENEGNISYLEDKFNDIEVDVSDLESRIDNIETTLENFGDDNTLECIDDDVDNIFVALGYLQTFLVEKYPKEEEKINEMFSSVTGSPKLFDKKDDNEIPCSD